MTNKHLVEDIRDIVPPEANTIHCQQTVKIASLVVSKTDS